MRRYLGLTFLIAGTVLRASTGRPDALADLADRARALPAELAADALLRVASAPSVTDAAWRRALVEDAFHLAAGAQEPFARRPWSESAGGLFDKAYQQGLDACTLQCRAVHAMLELDYRKARELFASIPVPQPRRLKCDDALVDDVSVFYETAAEVAARAFSPKEVKQDEPFHFLESYVVGVSSPLQVAPVARMLIAASWKDQQFESTVDTLTETLKQLSSDSRSFAATAGEPDSTAVAAVAAECARRRISPVPLLDAWRAYVARNLKGERCADLKIPRLPPGLQPISGDEMKAGTPGGEAVPADACESPECRALSARFSALVMGPNAFALTAEDKSKTEWNARLRQFLAAAADWKDTDNPAECFHMKEHFFGELFHTTPNGPDRDLLLAALLNWLQNNGYQREHRVEWFYAVNALIIRVFNDPAKMQPAVRALRESADPVISLYVQLEQLLPRPPLKTFLLL